METTWPQLSHQLPNAPISDQSWIIFPDVGPSTWRTIRFRPSFYADIVPAFPESPWLPWTRRAYCGQGVQPADRLAGRPGRRPAAGRPRRSDSPGRRRPTGRSGRHVVAAVEITVQMDARGRGLSRVMIDAMPANAARLGFQSLIAPVRPTEATGNPPMAAYARLTRPDGLPVDPWLRTHVRAGGGSGGPRRTRSASRQPGPMAGVDRSAVRLHRPGTGARHAGPGALRGRARSRAVCRAERVGAPRPVTSRGPACRHQHHARVAPLGQVRVGVNPGDPQVNGYLCEHLTDHLARHGIARP